MQSAPPKTPTRMQRILAYRRLHICAIVVFALDQLTKAWIHNNERLPFNSYGPGEHIEVIPGFFNIVHVGNTGAAWSILSGHSEWLAVFAAVVLAAIFFFRKTLELHVRAIQIAFGLLCGGIAGNLVDRVMHKHVIDFLDFHFAGYAWPAFNIADIGIVAGVVIYIGTTIMSAVRERRRE
ncbi:signal peptidase II [Ereboglobus sp. PH5-10]|uniref:signal peptidase II n=2 Tax=unclassified Ereboglobus TaxID=2626932 RepID=UPI002407251E|nr:signal peptidase II [Ereboglobus sp. PH5-10]MDF9828302.1 signal peptidase II [Ereboglobus sp. PH5-10]